MPRTFVSSDALPRRSSVSVFKKLAVLVILLTAVGSMVSGQTNDDCVNRTVIGSEDWAVRGKPPREQGSRRTKSRGQSRGQVRMVDLDAEGEGNGGSEFDIVLGVYTGTPVGALTRLASNNDGGGNRTNLVRFSVTVS